MKKTILKVTTSQNNLRIDQYLGEMFPEYSRNYFANLIKNNGILINEHPVKPSYKIKTNDEIAINFAESQSELPPTAQEIELDIIYEDNDAIVINKKPGMVVHPAAGNHEGTLVNALLFHFPKIKETVYDNENIISKQRPGLVHRLDKDTSGVIIVAKNARAMHSFSRQIQKRTTQKIYLALCFGWPKSDHDRLINHLGRNPHNRLMIAEIGKEHGKEAISDYKVLQYLQDPSGRKYSLIEFDIKTGRTHQIRAQAKILNCPVLGDLTYGSKESLKAGKDLGVPRQLLHAKSLKITLPGAEKPSIFQAEVPRDFINTLNLLTEIPSL